MARLRDAFFEKRNDSTQAALQACEMTVAIAAPFTPMSRPKISSGSRTMLRNAPITIESMAIPGLP